LIIINGFNSWQCNDKFEKTVFNLVNRKYAPLKGDKNYMKINLQLFIENKAFQDRVA